MPKVNVSRQTGVYLDTTNGNTTTAATFSTRKNTIYNVYVRVVGAKVVSLLGTPDAWGEGASYGLVASFRNTNGTLAQLNAGAATALWTHEQAESGVNGADITPSGTDILVRVAGAPGERWRWNVYTEIQEIGVDSAVPN